MSRRSLVASHVAAPGRKDPRPGEKKAGADGASRSQIGISPPRYAGNAVSRYGLNLCSRNALVYTLAPVKNPMQTVGELFSLAGRVAIVTGASRGLGKEAAEGLAEAGANVVLAARREQWLEPTAREFESRGFGGFAHPCDIASEEQTQKLVAAALERYGRVDILVNNAGITWGAPFEEMPVDAWRRVLETNIMGTQLMTRAVLPAMKQQGYGKVINIASVVGLVGIAKDILQASGYTASKGALIALTRELAVQYAAHGIRVNALAPGFFPTRLSAGVIEKSSERIRAITPLGLLGEAGEMKGAVVFLAAPASDYITGQIIAVDGGMTSA